MISLELIFPETEKRLCMRIEETTKVGDFRKYLKEFFGANNNCILMMTSKKDVTDDMSLTEAGMCTGSGVIISDEPVGC